jgi:lipase chaperone LimK
MDTKAKDLEHLERDYWERKAQIRADNSLSWEKQEKAIKALSDEYHARRRELERSAA